MNKKIAIEIIILILIICLSMVLVFLCNLTILNKNTKNDGNNNVNSTNVENVNYTNGNSIDNEIDYNNSDYIFYNEKETGKAQYNREHLKNFDFDIINIPNEVLSYIKDINEFNIVIKEYAYKNGLVDATIAEYESYEKNEEYNGIEIIFELNNEDTDKLLVIINLSENSIEVSDY